ncbi:MAG: ribbon-helix-helix domain-containing protein [Rubricella sp.]
MESERPAKHSVTLRGHRTSISLEPDFWDALREVAAERQMPLNALVAEIDEARDPAVGLASAIRVYLLRRYRGKAD